MSARPATPASERIETGEEQVLVPGIAAISLRARLEHRMAGPMRATKFQKPLDIGLFDLAARNQLDLF